MNCKKHIIRKLILTLIVGGQLISSGAFCQSIADIQSPKILPPSPEAAALGKYGQMPVDKSTGIPEISIPLYEIKTPRFTLPVSLSYHASGIKVDESAPWVGIGWSLNAGGVITRSMVGVADDSPAGYLFDYSQVPSAQDIYNNFHADSSFLQRACQNAQDSEPDNFFYNFAGQAGAFIFGPDAARTPLVIPYKPLKITYTTYSNFGTIRSFTIKDEKGDAYIFNDTEMSYSTVSSNMTGASSWYLSKMISADKTDTVSFYYKPDAAVFVDNAYSFTQNLGPGPTSPSGVNQVWNLVNTTNTSHCQQIHIDSIVFKGGKVTFIPKAGRKDNGTISLDSVIVYNYDFNKKSYQKLKSFKLQTDYFYSSLYNPTPYNYNTDSTSRYRLRLSGLSENDGNNNAIKTHQFTYNSTMLPPVHNFGQDTWGYYNGNYANPTLLRTQQVISNQGANINQPANTVFTIGGPGIGGDRSVSAANMQAGVLQQITYPTKGSTVFTFEPNQYLAPAITTYTPSASSVGVYRPTTTVNFTPGFTNPNQTSGQLIFHVHLSQIINLSSYVKLIETDNNAVIYYYTPNSYANVDMDVPLTVTAGVQYTLMAVVIGGSSSSTSTLPVAAISTTYQEASAPVPTNVGGLRISAINNYDSNGAVISTETYKYGLNETGAGDFMSYSSLLVNQSQHQYQFSIPDPPGVLEWLALEMTYSNSSVYALSSLNGSPVGYDQVTVYNGNATQNIGKSIYRYTITPDSILITPNTFNYMPLLVNNTIDYTVTQGLVTIPVLWKNGDPVSEAYYRNNGSGQYLLEQSKSTDYNWYYRTGGTGLYVQSALEFYNTPSGTVTLYANGNDFIVYNYPISVGSRQPVRTISTEYAPDGITPLTADTTKYYYGNRNHMFPTTVVSYDGKGDSLLKQVKYPQDMVASGQDPTGIYAAMTTANMISPAIQVTQIKNTVQKEQSLTNYASTNGIINPSAVSLQVLNNPAETRLSYQYDNSGNPQTIFKPGGAPVSYLWGYKGEYPVAQATSAGANDLFFESFEYDGSGNSTFGDARTGNYSHIGAYSKTLSGLDNIAYVLTYWLKSGTSWSLQTVQIPTISSGSYTISINPNGASTQVDDIRVYPASAQMTTFTYAPLVGTTSSTDTKGEITYYEYDSFQRLLNIKDKDGNIVKHMNYHYQGQ